MYTQLVDISFRPQPSRQHFDWHGSRIPKLTVYGSGVPIERIRQVADFIVTRDWPPLFNKRDELSNCAVYYLLYRMFHFLFH
jgi:hypothetical protein